MWMCVCGEIYTIDKRLFYPFLHRNSRFDHILLDTKRLAPTDKIVATLHTPMNLHTHTHS